LEREVNEEGKEDEYMCEYGTLKPVEVILRRGKREK
jgi:hypothetical protein